MVCGHEMELSLHRNAWTTGFLRADGRQKVFIRDSGT